MTDLFSSITIKNFTFKNRIGVAPMTRMSAGPESIPRQDVRDFLVTRAKKSAALVYTEAIVTDYESAQGYPGQSRILNQLQVDAWKKVTDDIRTQAAVSILQAFHCGRMAYDGINPANRVIAPSPVAPRQDNPMTGKPYPVPEQMSRFDMAHVKNGFAQTAMGAMEAGFDGFELHCAHGYLLNQFLSGYSNRREDEYGGSMENRFRFIREVIEAVRKKIPEDRLLTIRISNWGIADSEVSLFESADEWTQMIGLFSSMPIDAISVSTYDFSNDVFGTGKTMAALTKAATDLPVLICGKIYNRQRADEALADADIILSAKSMLLDPNWVAHVETGEDLKAFTSEDAGVAYTEKPLP